MKYFFLILVTILQVSGFSYAHAGGAMTGGSTMVQQFAQLAEEIPTSGATVQTSIAQTAQTANDLIGKPVATALINRAVDEVANQTVAFVNGGFNGSAPLIVPDPKKEIEKQGLLFTKRALEAIPEDSVYGNSIFSAILEQNKDTSIEDELTALSQSNTPSILYNKYCKDSQALTDLAINNVKEDNGTYDLAVVANEKQRLDAYMCSEDPTTSKEASARLQDIYKQNPNMGGLTGLMDIASNNEYTRSVLATNLVANKKGEVETFTTKNIYDGVGSLSQTECIKKSLTTKVGEEPTCLESRIITAGKTVDAMLSQAATAGAERLSNLTGEGIANAVISIAVNRLVSGIASYKLPSSSQTGTVTLPNISRVSKSVSTPQQDLIADPTTKKATLKPMLADLTAFLSSLDSLEKTDTLYLQDLRAYEAKITTGRACYQDLITNKGMTSSNSQIANAFAFYDKRQASINSVKNILTEELQNISSASSLAQKTITALKASNSSAEISTIFNGYQDTVDTNGYPTSQTEPVRRGEYTKNKFQTDHDDEIGTYYQTCQNLGTSMYNPYNGNN